MLAGTSLCATTAWAASRLETVVVFGERDTRQLNETTSNTDIIAEEAISSPKIEHLHQLLQSVPGVWLSRGSGQEHLTAIRSPVFTGAGACGAFGMTEDGIALRANGFCNANQMFDSHYEVAQQIEIYKGPHTSMVGGNAQFGGINIHLPRAREVADQVAINANTEGYRRFNGQIAATGEIHAGAALITLIEDDGFREQSGVKQQKLSLKHSWHNDTWHSVESGLSLMHLEQETAGYIEGRDAYKSSDLIEQNQNPEAYRDADSLRLYSRFRQRNLDREWVITPYLRSNDMTFLMHFVPWKPVEENSHDSLGWQLQWTRYLARGSKMFWGQEFDQTWASLTEVQAQTAPEPFPPQAFPQGVHYDYRVSAQNAALYGGGFWQKTQNLALDTAIRLDYVRYDYQNRSDDGSACEEGASCRFYRPASRVDILLEPSAHLGAVYHMRNQLYGFGRMALSFRAPQATELYRAQSEDISEIEAETTYAAELGMRAQFHMWFFEVSLYAMENHDGIMQDSERRYVNGVDSRHTGLEYEVQFDNDGSWLFIASGQYAKHTYRNNPNLLGSNADTQLRGLEMDTAPRHEHSLQAKWQPLPSVSLGAQLYWQGEYFLDAENQFVYEGHGLLDIDSSWDVTERVQMQVSLLNVFDRRYAERADAAFGKYRYFPGLERRLALALNYQF